MHEARHHIAIGARHLHFGAALQNQEALPVGVGLNLPHQIEVYDRRAVDALELARIQATLEVLHRFAKDQRIVAGIDAHVIARRVDPRGLNKRQLESLIASGGFDALHSNRAGVHALAEAIMASAQAATGERESAQVALFGATSARARTRQASRISRRRSGVAATAPPSGVSSDTRW